LKVKKESNLEDNKKRQRNVEENKKELKLNKKQLEWQSNKDLNN